MKNLDLIKSKILLQEINLDVNQEKVLNEAGSELNQRQSKLMACPKGYHPTFKGCAQG